MKTNSQPFRAAVLGLCLAAAVSASANQVQVGYPGSSYGPYQSGSGGEFTINVINPNGWLDLSGYAPTVTSGIGVAGTFQTFCLEGNENIGGYANTYNAVVNQNAVWGNVGPVGDPLSVGTGWLYSQFAQGTLSGYAFGGTVAQRKASALNLQNTFWWLEGESGIVYNAGNPFMLAVVTQFGTQAAAKVDGAWNYGVYALNLTTANGGRVQDQLYYRVPDGGTTVMLLGLALGGVSILARRKH